MSPAEQFAAFLDREHACGEGLEWVAGRPFSRRMWRRMLADWQLWLAGRSGVDRRRIVLAGALCAWYALRFVPDGEGRPAAAVDLARRFGLGEDIAASELRAAAARTTRRILTRLVRRAIGYPRIATALRTHGVECEP